MKCVYKIVCRDKEITEFYIGSSVDFHSRKSQHKSNSNNLNRKVYCTPLYMFINVNGGFDNWEIVVIKEYKFITKKELNINEQYYIELLKPQLNSNNAYGKDEEYYSNNRKKIQLSNKLYKLNNSEQVKETTKIYRSKYNKIKDNCPFCCKEMLKSSIHRHIDRKHKI